MLPFDEAAQAAIRNGRFVTFIPGAPEPPSGAGITTSAPVQKLSVPPPCWSHEYKGPAFLVPGDSVTLELPYPALAAYVYVQPYAPGAFAFSITTETGGSSGPVPISAPCGATGLAFFSTTTAFNTLTIGGLPGAGSFYIAEFGITPWVGCCVCCETGGCGGGQCSDAQADAAACDDRCGGRGCGTFVAEDWCAGGCGGLVPTATPTRTPKPTATPTRTPKPDRGCTVCGECDAASVPLAAGLLALAVLRVFVRRRRPRG